MLNSSLKDDDELQALVDEDSSINMDSVQHTHGIGGSLLNGSSGSCCCWDSSCSTISQEQTQARYSPDHVSNTVVAERMSSSSGFVSMRSSSQSYKSSCVESKTQSVTVTTTVQQKSSESYSSSVTVIPPALPVKQRSRRERHPSQYDNVPPPDNTSPTRPPPLPLKKKHMFQSVAYSVMAYMEMFGNCSQPNTSEYLRHSVHTYSLLQAEWQQHELTLSSTQSCSFHSPLHTQVSIYTQRCLATAHSPGPVSTCVILYTHTAYCRQSGNSVSSPSVLHSPARSLTTSHPGQYIYTEMPGNCSQPSTSEYLCHSVHTYSLLQAESGNSVSSLSVLHSPARSLTTSHPGQYIYTEMPGNCSQPSTSEYLCHSVHTYSLLQAEWQQCELTLSSTQSCSFTHHFTP
ncbi:uncharacterized protein LOC124373247, partial [Homalodisca vitripennis]|uniref:uncharacterized protein LOC124373247 n=1 Tax=Homalodisca vitripennis TaxID=197043 RepID=UPI001EECA07F